LPISPIPVEYLATPYLICRNAAAAIEWYGKAFGAGEVVRLADSSGKVMHAEIRIGAAPIMLADEFPEMGYSSPETIGGSPVSIHVYVANAGETFAMAVKAGATEIAAVSDQFDGTRRGTLKDPFGHTWLLTTRVESITFGEMKARFDKMMGG
jgi:PhnB protein